MRGGAEAEEREAMRASGGDRHGLSVADHLVLMMHSLSSLAVDRLGVSPEAAARKDLEQARAGHRRLQGAARRARGEARRPRRSRAHRAVLSQLQMAYVAALAHGGARRAAEAPAARYAVIPPGGLRGDGGALSGCSWSGATAKGESMSVQIGIIGGSGLYDMAELTDREEVRLSTPFGDPSGPYVLATLRGRRVAFLARHGAGHTDPAVGAQLPRQHLRVQASGRGADLLGERGGQPQGRVSAAGRGHPRPVLRPDRRGASAPSSPDRAWWRTCRSRIRCARSSAASRSSRR